MERNREYSIFGRHIGYIIASQIAVLLLGLIQIPILTKGLGASLYGIFSVLSITISLISYTAVLGLSTGVIRFLPVEKDKSRLREGFLSAYFTVCLSAAVFSAVLLLFSDQFAAFILNDDGSAIYVRLTSILVLMNSVNIISMVFFRVLRQMGLYAIITLIYHICEVGLIAAAILLGYKLTGVLGALIINGVLFNLILLIIILRRIGLSIPRFSDLKPYLLYSLPLILNPVIIWIINSSDRYLVSYFAGVAATGIYSAAYVMGNYASFALTPLTIVLYPTVAKAYDEADMAKTKNYLRYSIKYLMMTTIPAAFGLSILARPLLTILTTPEFISGSIVVPFVAFGAVLFCLFQVCIYVVHLVKKTYWSLLLMSASAILNIVLNMILIPRLGILGAAVATFLAYGMLGIATVMVSRRYLKFDLSLPFIGRSIISAGIMTLCIWLISPQSLWAVLLSIFLGAVLYLAVLWAIKGFSKGEIAFFANFVKGNLGKIGLTKE